MSLHDVIAEQDRAASEARAEAARREDRHRHLIDEFLNIAGDMGDPGKSTWELSGDWIHDVVRHLPSPISGWILDVGEFTNTWMLAETGALLSFWSADGCGDGVSMYDWSNQSVVPRRRIYCDWGDQDLEQVLAATLRNLRAPAEAGSTDPACE